MEYDEKGVGMKITVEATREFMFEACSLVYSRWTKEYDLLKAVRKEVNDGSKDWQAFHDHRVKYQIGTEAKWRKLSDEAAELSSLVVRR